jgi:hypothetical protein
VKFLSRVGNGIPLKVVIQAIPTYGMRVFHQSKTLQGHKFHDASILMRTTKTRVKDLLDELEEYEEI